MVLNSSAQTNVREAIQLHVRVCYLILFQPFSTLRLTSKILLSSMQLSAPNYITLKMLSDCCISGLSDDFKYFPGGGGACPQTPLKICYNCYTLNCGGPPAPILPEPALLGSLV